MGGRSNSVVSAFTGAPITESMAARKIQITVHFRLFSLDGG
jgi:hypothetical protein